MTAAALCNFATLCGILNNNGSLGLFDLQTEADKLIVSLDIFLLDIVHFEAATSRAAPFKIGNYTTTLLRVVAQEFDALKLQVAHTENVAAAEHCYQEAHKEFHSIGERNLLDLQACIGAFNSQYELVLQNVEDAKNLTRNLIVTIENLASECPAENLLQCFTSQVQTSKRKMRQVVATLSLTQTNGNEIIRVALENGQACLDTVKGNLQRSLVGARQKFTQCVQDASSAASA